MKEIVFVPTYQRSAFLWCCLEAIRKAEPTIEIIVQPDRSTDETTVCAEFNATHRLTPQHDYHGNSFNMFEGLKFCYEQGYDRVFVVEDDCIVDTTFFDWARNALDNPKPWMGTPFAACGWNYSPDQPLEEGPDVLLDWYLSVCCAIPRRTLERIVNKFATEAYYSNMQEYLDTTFPRDSLKGGLHYEQDGAILRLAKDVGERCSWPRRPRAIHIGWKGYHMPHGKMPETTLAKQVMIVKMAISDPATLQHLMQGNHPPDVADCKGCHKPLVSTNREADVICTECFHKRNPGVAVASLSHYYLNPKLLVA
jgi:hypothetical protein